MSPLWGIPYFFIKIAVEELHPFVIVFGRTALGAAILLPIAVQTGTLRALRGRLRPVLLLTASPPCRCWSHCSPSSSTTPSA
jgi:drug/metabolite transporter (DMT)-like permease